MPASHTWDEEGDHCTKCGDLAWCSSPDCDESKLPEYEATIETGAVINRCKATDLKDAACRMGLLLNTVFYKDYAEHWPGNGEVDPVTISVNQKAT